MAGSGTTSPPAYPSAVASAPSSSRLITLPRTHSDDEPRPRIAKSGYLPVVLFLPCFTGSIFPRRFRSSPTPIDSSNTPTVKPRSSPTLSPVQFCRRSQLLEPAYSISSMDGLEFVLVFMSLLCSLIHARHPLRRSTAVTSLPIPT